MGIVLGPHRYGKAENRLVRIDRDRARHEIRDLNVSTSLTGDFAAAHLVGDQSRVLPTDSQKQTVYAFAKQHGVGEIEDFALALARHFERDVEPVDSARVGVHEYAWQRIRVDGVEHDHSWVRSGQEVRTTLVTVGEQESVVSGLTDLVLLKSTGSEFADFLVDDYTTLQPTHDRILATSLTATWTYAGTGVDWGAAYAGIRRLLVERFATLHSRALQQTLYEMGRAVLAAYADVTRIDFAAPNRHHVVYDLTPFGLDNPNEVFHVADRPYGLIEASVLRDDAVD